jgi:hypothetical protein
VNNYEYTIENQGIKFSTIVTAENDRDAEKQALGKIERITGFDPTWSGDFIVSLKSERV